MANTARKWWQRMISARTSDSRKRRRRGRGSVRLDVESLEIRLTPSLAFGLDLKGAASDSYGVGYSVAADAAGNTFVTGYFYDSVNFNPAGTAKTLTASAGNDDQFIAKYSSTGQLDWVKDLGPNDSGWGWALAVDGSGNAIVGGSFSGTVTFGTTTLTASGYEDGFMVKLDPNGNYLWALDSTPNNAGGEYGETARIAVDNSNNIYAITSFAVNDYSYTTTIGVVKYSGTNGNTVWTEQISGNNNDYYYDYGYYDGIAVDNAGNVDVLISYYGTVTFGKYSFQSVDSTYSNTFVAQFNAGNGTVNWAEAANPTYDAYGYGLAVDSAGSVYVSILVDASAKFQSFSIPATYGYDCAVLKLSGTNGNVVWGQLIPQDTDYDETYLYGLAVDGAGNLYGVGEVYCYNALKFGPSTIPADTYDCLLVDMSTSTGSFLKAASFGTADSEALGCCVDNAGNLAICGYIYQGTGNLDPTGGTLNVNVTSEEDVFVEKIGNLSTPVLSFSTQPANASINSSLGSVTVIDMNGATPVAGATITVSLSTGTLGGTASVLTNAAGLATFSNLTVSAAGTYTLSATSSGAATAVSNSFTISAPVLAFSTSPANTSAGSAFTVGLTYSSGGTPIAGASVTLAISSGTLNGPTTATTSASGVATFSGLSVTTPGTYTLYGSIGYTNVTSKSFTISAATVATLSFTTEPVGTTAGGSMSPIVIAAADPYGNAVAGLAVKLSISSGTLNGTLTATTNASGLATFSGLSDSTAGTYSLTAAAGTVTALSSSFTIGTAGLASLAFTTEPVGATAGVTLGPVVVKAVDSFGNILSGTVISLSISAGTLNGTLVATSNASGLATFAGLSDATAGTYTVTAASGSVNTPSIQFIIAPAAAAKLTFTAEPPGVIAVNSTLAVVVQATDAFGNAVPNVNVTLTPSSGTLNGTKTAASDTSGNATFNGLSLGTVGTGYTMTATAAGLSAQSSVFDVTPGAFAVLTFTIQPMNAAAGSTLGPVTVKATDAFGNVVTGVSLAVSISGTLNGTTSLATNSSGLDVFSTLSIDQVGTYTLTAMGGGVTASSQAFVISAAAPATLVFTSAPVSTTAGVTFSTVAVNVTDKFSNPVSNVTVKLTAAANTSGSLNGTTSVNTDAAGTASFVTLSMTRAGTYALTASVTGATSIASGSFTIAPAAPAQLLFTTQPKGATAGTALNVAVEALDSFGNTVPGVTVSSLTLSPAMALDNFAATTTTTTGIAAINGLSVNTMGTYTMTASGAGLNATSASFIISPATIALISFVNQPGTTNAGNVIGPVTAQAVDAFGNPVPNVGVCVALGGGSFCAGTTTMMTNTLGQAVFGNLATKTIGTYTLGLSATGIAGVTSNSFSVIVAAPMLSFAIQPVNANDGSTMRTVVVRVTDKYGNVVPGLNVNLNLSSGTLKGTTAASTDAAGQASFSMLSIMPPGTGCTLTASATGLPSVRSNAFNILALHGSTLAFVTQPVGTTAGGNLGPVSVQSLDINNNPVSGVPVTISLSASGKLRGALSAVTDNTGTAVFSNLSENLTGTYTLKAASQGMTTTSSAFAVTPASAAKLTFTSQPAAAVAGNPLQAMSVLVTDKYGNVVSGATVNVSLLAGSLASGTPAIVSNALGKAGFMDLVEDEAGTFTLIATSGPATAVSRSFVVKAAAVSQLVFLTQPGNGKAGTALSPFIVQARDSFGNVVTASSTAIRVSDGTLSKGPYLTSQGKAVIANWTETLAGTYTLTASANGVASVESNSFAIVPAVGVLSFVNQPTTTVAGSDIGPVTMRITDRYGNIVSGVAVTIGITPGVLSSGRETLTTDSNGEVVFDPLTENLAGTYALVATAAGVGKLKSRTFTISVARQTSEVFS